MQTWQVPNIVDQALPQSLLSSHLQQGSTWPVDLPPSQLLCSVRAGSRRRCHNVYDIAESPNSETFPSSKNWMGTKCVSPSVFCSKSCGLKLSIHVSVLSYLHLSPNKCEGRQREGLYLCQNNLMLWRLVRPLSTRCHIRLGHGEHRSDSSFAGVSG